MIAIYLYTFIFLPFVHAVLSPRKVKGPITSSNTLQITKPQMGWFEKQVPNFQEVLADKKKFDDWIATMESGDGKARLAQLIALNLDWLNYPGVMGTGMVPNVLVLQQNVQIPPKDWKPDNSIPPQPPKEWAEKRQKEKEKEQKKTDKGEKGGMLSGLMSPKKKPDKMVGVSMNSSVSGDGVLWKLFAIASLFSFSASIYCLYKKSAGNLGAYSYQHFAHL